MINTVVRSQLQELAIAGLSSYDHYAFRSSSGRFKTLLKIPFSAAPAGIITDITTRITAIMSSILSGAVFSSMFAFPSGLLSDNNNIASDIECKSPNFLSKRKIVPIDRSINSN